jgi:asparagine synthase (glutamine-hydrolysing)
LLDEPLADASIIPTYFLSKFTRKYVTVALGGDGSDELFAGYPTFHAQEFADFYSKLPLSLRKFIETGIKKLPSSDKNFSWDFKLKKFITGVSNNKYYRHQDWLGSFNKEERQKLFKPVMWQKLAMSNEFEELDFYAKESGTAEFNNQLLYLYLRTYLMDGVLVKVDRASMYNALEIRAPFLDYKLVDFVSSLPYNYKYHHFQTKYILKKLMTDKLPKEIVFRSKKGFGMPVATWLRDDLKHLCNELLSRENIEKIGLFNFEYIDKIKNEHFSGQKDNRKMLWTLMVFIMWQENFGS